MAISRTQGTLAGTVACAIVVGCSGPGPTEPSQHQVPEGLSSCGFTVTENSYDGPNYWGTIGFKNDGPSSSSGFAVTFEVPAGVHCDFADAGWKYAQSGRTCRYTKPGTVLRAGQTLVFHYSTDSTGFRAASDVAVRDATCASVVADAGPPPDPCAKLMSGTGPSSQWAYADATGKLAYKTMPRGDRILDFSYAGYGGGGVAIPLVPVKKTVSPSGGDDTAAINAALAGVSALPVTGGFRGAVLLAPGTFEIAGTLAINTSGVVLRGSGSGAGGTVLHVTGAPRQVMRVNGSGAAQPDPTATARITDSYVPSGARSFDVDNPAVFAVGDSVLVQRPVTAAWVHFMGMDTLVRDGLPQTWIAPGTLHTWERSVTAIVGHRITVDIPLSDSLDAQFVQPPGATVSKFTFPGRIAQVGVEHLRLVTPPRSATEEFGFLKMNDVEDAWVRDLAVHDFTNGIWIDQGAKRVTVEDTAVTHDPTAYATALKPFDFWLNSSETLIQRSSSQGGLKIWYLATQDGETGPNVVLDFTGTGTGSAVTAHQKWATGLLVDGATVAGGISMGNNGTLGSGEGWSMGWGVVWNSTSDVLVQAPPGATNWAIGSTGAVPLATGLGSYDSPNAPVRIKSLYLAQLCERLGPQAVSNIGY